MLLLHISIIKLDKKIRVKFHLFPNSTVKSVGIINKIKDVEKNFSTLNLLNKNGRTIRIGKTYKNRF